MAAASVCVQLNGRQESIIQGMTIESFLTERDINPDHVVVEINQTIIPRDQFTEIAFKQDDQVEILRFVGGG